MRIMQMTDLRRSQTWLRALGFIAGLAVFFAAGCDRSRSETASAGETGSVSVTVLALNAADVATATLTVLGPDIPVPIQTAMVTANGQWRTTLGGIPAGPTRTFTFSARDVSGAQLYHGETTGVTIVANQTQEVTIVAQQSVAPPPFSDALPVIDLVQVSSTTAHPGENLSLLVTAHDADQGDTLTYAWAAQAGSFSGASAKSTVWTAPATTGSFVLSVSVQDRKQKGATASVSITVSATLPPEPAPVPIPGWAAGLLALVLVAAGRRSIFIQKGRT